MTKHTSLWMGISPIATCLLAVGLPGRAGQRSPAVMQSARGIPLAYEVDVVVVGGSTGAVSAAVAAAANGAKVFLAAPRPYLGEDVCATLRLWLEPGEQPVAPLAKALYAASVRPAPQFDPADALNFEYEADRPSAGRHKDTDPPSVLTDGLWGPPNRQSVQYDGDVNITADLRRRQAVGKAYVMLYHTRDFLTDSVTVSVSDDNEKWQQVALVRNSAPPQPTEPRVALPLAADVGRKTRYVRFGIKKGANAARVLVGEIVLLRPAGTAKPPPEPAFRYRLTPLHAKRTLDNALLAAGVKFLFGCYVTDVLRDEKGACCGIVMANRAGRQAVLGKVIIDATDWAAAARSAGARFHTFSPGTRLFKRVVIGGEARGGKHVTAREIPLPFHVSRTIRTKERRKQQRHVARIIEYTLALPLPDAGFAALAEAEQLARDKTYHPEILLASERLFCVPPERIKGVEPVAGSWGGAARLPLDAFRPAGVQRLYVLGGCADIPRDQAEKLLRPLALMDMGARIGAAAGAEAKRLPAPKGASLPGGKGNAVAAGEVHEVLVGVRPIQELPTVPAEQRPLPVLGRYDVVVIGGGTSGAPAAIGAARGRAGTLVVEYLHALGGVGTLGAIGRYYHGYRGGFTKEVDAGVGRGWSMQAKMEWWRSALRKAGGQAWFGCLGCGAFVRDGKVAGAVVATPLGRGVVLAKTVVDATGNADVAAAAGAACRCTDADDIAVQGTGLPPLSLGAVYTNTDFTLVDETDVVDTSHVFVYTRAKFGRAFDQGQLIDTRERRTVVGEFTMTILDQVLARTYPDTIGVSASDFDSHGYTTDPFFVLSHPRSTRAHTPYRCLLPKGLDGILVTGLGFSAHRDAIPMTRMQPDLQNQGYAAGVAAAMAARTGGATRKIDLRALQKHLVEVGCVPPSVLTDKDSLPLPPERIARTVRNVAAKSARDDKDVAAILAHPDRALPLLRQASAAADSDRTRLRYAHVRAVMGDGDAAPVVIAAVENTPDWDKGWDYRGMGQYGDNMSPLDKLIYALGRTRNRRAVPAICDKVKRLDAHKSFSHHRAVALALEMLADQAAGEPLAELLAKPGMTGHAIHSVADAVERMRTGTDTSTRRNAIRELLLARALYRCGDKDGLGEKLLTDYTRDLRGHLARHAHAVLQAGPGPYPKPGTPDR